MPLACCLCTRSGKSGFVSRVFVESRFERTIKVLNWVANFEKRVCWRHALELEKLTWIEAESALTEDTVVLIALGAAAKEHGPHLRLDNDFQMAEYLKRRVMAQTAAVVAPTISYHYYPAFQEYPGSTHLTFDTARDLVVDVVKSLARF